MRRRRRIAARLAGAALIAAGALWGCDDAATPADRCREACVKLAECPARWVEHAESCNHQCDREGVYVNLDLADCIVRESCETLAEVCFPDGRPAAPTENGAPNA